MTDQPKRVAPIDHEPFEPMACCGRERDKDGGRNPHCECPAELKPKPVAPEVDLDQLERLCDQNDTIGGLTEIRTAKLRALIAETRAHRAANANTDPLKPGTRVEVLQHGEWDLATVDQRGEPGRLLVKLDVKFNDENYYWVSREHVRLATKLPPLGVVTKTADVLFDELERMQYEYSKQGYSEGLAFRCALGDMRTSTTDPVGAAAKPPAGVEVTEALAALRILADYATPFDEAVQGPVALAAGAEAAYSTIRSALEKCR